MGLAMHAFKRYLKPMYRVFCSFFFAVLCSSVSIAEEDENNSAPDLWDVVEAGLSGPVSEEENQASEELQEARFAEQSYLDGGERPGEPDASIYVEPLETVSKQDEQRFKLDDAQFDIPVVYNDIVQKWMDYFQGRGKVWFTRYLERKSAWKPMVDGVFGEAGMPKDLIHVAMIESGFSNHAHSHASAVGMWQFIASVGRAYGLRVDYWIDARKDPFLATKAAAKFYGDLYRQFDDWWLAMAAYNTGPSRVRRGMKKYDTKDYWLLVKKKAIPPETRDYVGKVIAAAILSKNPEKYGFKIAKPHTPWRFEEVEVSGSVSLSVIARCAGVPSEKVDDLNPMLLRDATPPGVKSVVRIPVGTKESFLKAFAELPEKDRLSYARHTVESGEVLGVIAEKYGVSTKAVVEFNRLPNEHKIRVGMVLVIPVPSGSIDESLQGLGSSPVKAESKKRKRKTISVKPGDSLSVLAQRHGVREKDLVAWNKIKDPNSLSVGQKLSIHGSAPSDVSAKQKQAKKKPTKKTVHYTVKSGDTLYGIALKNKVSVDQIKAWNNLSSNTIQPGQKLKVGAE